MFKKRSKRAIRVEEWVNLGWIVLMIIALAIYWVNTPSILSEFFVFFENIILNSKLELSEALMNFMFFFIFLLDVRFFAFIAIGAVNKNYPSVIGNLAYTIILFFFGYVISSQVHVHLSPFETLTLMLILLGAYEVSRGITTGWFQGNERSVLTGNWGGIVLGIRLFVLSLFFQTEVLFTTFQSYTVLLAERLGADLSSLSLYLAVIVFLEVCAFAFLLTELPIRLVFSKCKTCSLLFMKLAVHVSSWDSEHTSAHRHCPRCGSPVF